MLVLYRTRNPFLASAWTARSSIVSVEGDDNGLSNGDGGVDDIRGRIEDAYHDDPPQGIEGAEASSPLEESGNNGSASRGPIVQPSRLQNEGNEWR